MIQARNNVDKNRNFSKKQNTGLAKNKIKIIHMPISV
jgi:hypothetical protein